MREADGLGFPGVATPTIATKLSYFDEICKFMLEKGRVGPFRYLIGIVTGVTARRLMLQADDRASAKAHLM